MHPRFGGRGANDVQGGMGEAHQGEGESIANGTVEGPQDYVDDHHLGN